MLKGLRKNPVKTLGGIKTEEHSPKGSRTPVSGVRGRCPRPLDDGATFLFKYRIYRDLSRIR